MTELKPCPFCGNSTAVSLIDESDMNCTNYVVVCSVVELTNYPQDDWKCGCGATGGYAQSQTKAVEQWNRRMGV